MATEQNPDHNTPPGAPTPDDWRRYRENGVLPIWMAALLSLNIAPTPPKGVERRLQENAPEKYAAYEERVRVLRLNYDFDPDLPAIRHRFAMERDNGEPIGLEGLCRFAVKRQLQGAEPMIRMITPGLHAAQTDATEHVQEESPVDPSVRRYGKGNLPTGAIWEDELKDKKARYALYELGALAILLERVCLNPRLAGALTFGHGNNSGRLNPEAVARGLVEIFDSYVVSTYAGGGRQEASTVAGHLRSAMNLISKPQDGANDQTISGAARASEAQK